MIEVPKLEDVTKLVDKVTSTSEERDEVLTERLKLDTTSPFMLPHLIRPIIALVLLTLQILLFVAIFMEIEVPQDIIWQVGGLNAAAIGFYFNSRKAEKMQAKNAMASIEIANIQAKATVNEKKRVDRQDRKDKRRQARQARIDSRKDSSSTD